MKAIKGDGTVGYTQILRDLRNAEGARYRRPLKSIQGVLLADKVLVSTNVWLKASEIPPEHLVKLTILERRMDESTEMIHGQERKIQRLFIRVANYTRPYVRDGVLIPFAQLVSSIGEG